MFIQASEDIINHNKLLERRITLWKLSSQWEVVWTKEIGTSVQKEVRPSDRYTQAPTDNIVPQNIVYGWCVI